MEKLFSKILTLCISLQRSYKYLVESKLYNICTLESFSSKLMARSVKHWHRGLCRAEHSTTKFCLYLFHSAFTSYYNNFLKRSIDPWPLVLENLGVVFFIMEELKGLIATTRDRPWSDKGGTLGSVKSFRVNIDLIKTRLKRITGFLTKHCCGSTREFLIAEDA